MNADEINSQISKYNKKQYVNSIEDKENLEKYNSIENSGEPEREIEEDFTNYQIEESKYNEDINMQVTTRQKLDYFLSNGIFLQILSISSFIFSFTIYIIYVVTTYFPFVNFHWFDILNVVFSSFHILETYINKRSTIENSEVQNETEENNRNHPLHSSSIKKGKLVLEKLVPHILKDHNEQSKGKHKNCCST